MSSYEEYLKDFSLARFRLEIAAGPEGLNLPPFKGSTFRGGFGQAFRSMVCSMKGTECFDCMLKGQCPYSYIFETSPRSEDQVMGKFEGVPRPYIIEPPLERTTRYSPGEVLSFHLILIGRAIEYLPYFLATFVELGNIGIGSGRKPFVLRRAVAENPVKAQEFEIYSHEDKRVKNVDAVLQGDDFIALAQGLGAMDRITLNFDTPTRIKSDGRLTAELDFSTLVGSLLRRFSNLSYFHCGRAVSIDYNSLVDFAMKVSTFEDKTQWMDVERFSSRQQSSMKMGGLLGEITYAGSIEPYLPLLLLGEYIHLGKNATFGLGKYHIKHE